MASTNAFHDVFVALKAVLAQYESGLVVAGESPDNYLLNTPYSERWKKKLMFGAVQRKKNYVSYYLMPVYMCPELLDDMSPELRKRMQGKSCFNFKVVDQALLRELAQLTRRGFDRMKQDGYIRLTARLRRVRPPGGAENAPAGPSIAGFDKP